MILSYQAGRYGHLDTLNSKMHPLFQILDTDPGWCNNSGGGAGEGGGREKGGVAVVDDRGRGGWGGGLGRMGRRVASCKKANFKAEAVAWEADTSM